MTYEAYRDIRLHGFGDLLREQRRSRPHMPAAVEGDLRLSFTELDARVNRLVTALRDRGIGAGDRLLWLGQNSVKLLEVLFACAKLGAILCPANWRMTVAETRETIADFDPKVVFWQEVETGEVHRTSRLGWQDGRLWVQHDGSDHDCFDVLLESGRDEDDQLRVDPDLPLLAIYTAAHSGRPGAALLSHTAILLQAMLSARGQAIDESTCYLMSGPMFHIGVLMGGFATFASGGCCVIVPRTDAADVARLIDAERVTHGFVPQPLLPGMIEAVAEHGYDLSSLFSTADLSDWAGPIVMPPHAPQRARRGGYGQTEIMGFSILLWLGGEAAGRPNMFTQVMLLDDDGNEVLDGENGEIAVRGPLVMCGYWNRDEENDYRTRAGWHRTRDLGVRRPDGSLAFVGPKTTMIKTGVENVYPVEVENCLRQHPAVADACVIGVPDPRWDQNVKAVVVLKSGEAGDPQAIIAHCKARIASFKKPKIVVFVDGLPRLPTGALDRAAVDAAHGGGGYPRVG